MEDSTDPPEKAEDSHDGLYAIIIRAYDSRGHLAIGSTIIHSSSNPGQPII